jgi:large subunit ribosomal protein L17
VHKAIRTTKTKAKQASRLADKLITLGKDKSLINQRKAYSILCDRSLVSILFNELAPLFKERKGGYTRVMLINRRHGDNSQLAILEFVEKPKVEAPKKAEKKEKKKAPQPEVESKVKEIEKAPEPRKEEHPKKELPPVKKELKKPEKPIEKPGFFKRFFGRKGD